MIFEFVDVLGRRLVAWGLASVVAGAVATVAGDAFLGGLGAVFLAWGAVVAVLGAATRPLAERTRRRTIGDQAARDRARRQIRVGLVVAGGLDVLFAGIGAWLVVTAADDPWRTGAGWGILVQGACLFLLDLAHARWVPPPGPLLPAGVELFAGPGHDGFRLSRLEIPPGDPGGAESGAGGDADAKSGARGGAGAKSGARGGAGAKSGAGGAALHDQPGAPVGAASEARGALLVHGFAGSPRELRGLAAVLASNGWLVEVPRLPGHGAAFGDVADYRVEDWVRSVEEAAAALRASGATRLVVAGHAVGGSLALATAARLAPDALILLAPFCWPVPAWQRVVAPVLRVFLQPGFRVFGRIDLSRLEGRAGVEGFMPGVDLDDPTVVASVRELRVPLTLLEQLFRVSELAAAGAGAVRVPVLAIQGLDDAVSRPAQTRALLERLPSRPTYLEVDAGHDLVTEASPVRDRVLTAIVEFAERVAPGPQPGA